MVFRLPPMPRPDEKRPTAPKEKIAIQWPGHVVDPKWVKNNTGSNVQTCKFPPWRDAVLEGLEERLHDQFDPAQAAKVVRSTGVVLWEPLMCDFMECLAYTIQRAVDEPEFLAKIQGVPGNKVEPLPEVMPDKLRVEMSTELTALLRALQSSLTDAVDEHADKLDDTMIIRSIWEDDIRDGSSRSDVSTEEMRDAALEDMDDMSFEQEASRRGFRLTKM